MDWKRREEFDNWTEPDAHEVRIIALTANAFKEDLDKTKEAGMDLYITKPVKMDLIREKLSDI